MADHSGGVNAADLAALFDNVRREHQIDVMQSNLLGCSCGASLPIEYGDDGRPLYNPALRHHHEKQAEAVIGLRFPPGQRTLDLDGGAS